MGYRGPKGLPGKDASCLIGSPGKKGKAGEPGSDGSKGDIGPPGLPGREGIRKTLKNATRVQDLLNYIAEFKANFYQCCFGVKARSHIKRAIEDINISIGNGSSYYNGMTRLTRDNNMVPDDDDDGINFHCKYYQVNYDKGRTCNSYFKYCPFKKGPTGYPGPQGPRGDPGVQGYAGSKGDDGQDGKPGLQGPKGRIGLPGDEGPPGNDVYLRCLTQGPKGKRGAQGEKGNIGPRGVTGRRGRKGDACPSSRGPDGVPGIPGYPGIPGNKGQPGAQGPRGKRGDPATGDISAEELTNYKYQLKKLVDIVATGKCCYIPRY